MVKKYLIRIHTNLEDGMIIEKETNNPKNAYYRYKKLYPKCVVIILKKKGENMNKEQLQEKLNELIGRPANYIYQLGEYIRKEKLNVWFDNSQKVFAVGTYGQTELYIRYKGRYIIDFKIKRVADSVHGYVVKSVEIVNDFVDLETSINKVKGDFRDTFDNSSYWRWENQNKLDLVKAIKVLKQAFPNETIGDLRNMVSSLNSDFYLLEDLSNE